MLNFAAKHFRKFIEIILWINLVFCAIAGASIAAEASKGGAAGTVGFILGIVVGLLTNIIYGGLLAIFLSIHKDVKNINKWLQCMWQNSNSIKTDAKTTPIEDDKIYYFDF
jgi:hypothetical protein